MRQIAYSAHFLYHITAASIPQLLSQRISPRSVHQATCNTVSTSQTHNTQNRDMYIPSLENVKVAHTRLPSIGFRSWSRFLAVSLQMTSHKLGGRLPLLSARPTVTPATLKRAAANFAACWTEAQWVWTVCLRLLPDSIAAAIWTWALLHLSPAR